MSILRRVATQFENSREILMDSKQIENKETQRAKRRDKKRQTRMSMSGKGMKRKLAG